MDICKFDNWKEDFRPCGLLYFTQRIEEMLNPFTDHVFKMPVLNTALLVDEYLDNAEFVKAKTIDENHLTHIMEEFYFSFENDVVIEKFIEKAQRERILHKLKELSKREFKERSECRAIMDYLKIILRNYVEWCKVFLYETISKDKDIKIIEHGIRCFIPGMVSFGYSKSFIYRLNVELLNIKQVDSFSTLNLFLERFDYTKRDYDIYMAIDSGALQFQSVLEKRLFIDFGPFPDEMGIQFDKEKYILTKIKVSALDEYSAVQEAYDHLNIFFTYYCFLADRTENWFFNDSKVVDSEKVVYSIPIRNHKLCRKMPKDAKHLANDSDTIILELQNKKPSYNQINRALRLHNTAINESDVKNKFLNLWSTIEILFVSDKDKSKILEIKEKMLPVLLKDFLCYQFISIDSAIRTIAKQVTMNDIENKFPDEDKSAWPYYIVALDKYSEQRKQLCELLSNYPLLKYRIVTLSDLCKDKKKLKGELYKHSDRVSWHIYRLYRARNTIIHSGFIPNNLQELVEHLHSYADQCFYEILNILVFNSELNSISNALIESQLRKDEVYTLLDIQSPLCRSDLITILKYCYIHLEPSP